MTVGVLIIATDNVRVSGRSKKTRNEVFECRSRDFITIRVGPKEKIKKTVDELSFYFLFLENTKRYRFIYLFIFFRSYDIYGEYEKKLDGICKMYS